jgi:hypothetical protein
VKLLDGFSLIGFLTLDNTTEMLEPMGMIALFVMFIEVRAEFILHVKVTDPVEAEHTVDFMVTSEGGVITMYPEAGM